MDAIITDIVTWTGKGGGESRSETADTYACNIAFYGSSDHRHTRIFGIYIYIYLNTVLWRRFWLTPSHPFPPDNRGLLVDGEYTNEAGAKEITIF